MSQPYRLVFAGTPDFAVPPLDALYDAGHDIAAVFTQPDRPAGRGRKLTAPPVKRRAQALGLPVYQPASLKEADIQEELRSLAPEVMVVVAYGLLLPQTVLDFPALGCLNIHASLLPRWRGAAPIQRAIQAGDETTGISIMQMEAGLDTGPVLLQKCVPITRSDTSASLHNKLAQTGSEAIVKALTQLGDLTAAPQDQAQATHAAKLTKAEARLDWHKPAETLVHEIHAFNPWPVSFATLDEQPIRIWNAGVAPDTHQAAPGTVLAVQAQGIDIAAGAQSVIRLTRLQRAGGKPLAAREFLQSCPLSAGQVLA